MKIDTTFLKSEEFIAWIVINAVFPILIVGLYALIDFSMLGKNITSISCEVLMFGANVYYAIKWRGNAAFKFFTGIALLNLVAVFLVGRISFIVAIPVLPFFINSYFNMLTS